MAGGVYVRRPPPVPGWPHLARDPRHAAAILFRLHGERRLVVGEAAWRRRFRAARMSLPGWARDDPERLLYASNASGKWELYAWDRGADTHRQGTGRPGGT